MGLALALGVLALVTAMLIRRRNGLPWLPLTLHEREVPHAAPATGNVADTGGTTSTPAQEAPKASVTGASAVAQPVHDAGGARQDAK